MEEVIRQLESKGAELKLKLKVHCSTGFSSEDATLIETHKQELISYLAPHTNHIPNLPWQLQNLLRAASSKTLAVNIDGVTSVSNYVLAYVADYLLGDREHVLSKLWEVYNAWQEQLDQIQKKKGSK